MATSQEIITGDVVLGWEPNALVEIRRHARAPDLLLLLPKPLSGEVEVTAVKKELEAIR